MNRYLIAVIATVLITSFFIGCKPTPEEYKRDFVKGCVNRYAKDSTVASTEGRIWVEEYCNCLGDKLADKFSEVEQWRQFNKSEDTTLADFQQAFNPCIEEFSNKISKQNK